MKTTNHFILVFLMLLVRYSYSQEEALSSEEALKLHKELGEFIQNVSLETNPELYFFNYFRRLDLIPYIKDNHTYVLSYYHNLGYSLCFNGLRKESIGVYKAFFAYYKINERYLTEDEKQEFFRKRSFDYGMLAESYSKLSHTDSAAVQHKLNVDFVKHSKTIWHPSALNNYGLFFLRTKKDLDSALIYFNKAYEITKKGFPNSPLFGDILDNIANIYVARQQFKKANQLYKDIFAFYKRIPLTVEDKGVQRFIGAGVKLIETDLQLNNLREAEQHFFQLENIASDTVYNIKLHPHSKLKFSQVKEVLFLKQNKIQAAYQISKEVKYLSDSLNTMEAERKKKIQNAVNDVTLDRFRISYELEKAQKENKIERQKLKLWIIAITSISMFGFLSSLFLRRRQHIINAKNKQLLAERNLKYEALKNEKLYSEIESKQRDLSDFAVHLSQTQEWAKVLAGKLEALKMSRGRERRKLLISFEQEILNKITFDTDTKEFYERLDQLSNAFYSKLRDKFPNLSKTETRLCSLIRLRIESHQIASLQNITISSLNTSRYRLRKKLNLSENHNLDNFIQRL